MNWWTPLIGRVLRDSIAIKWLFQTKDATIWEWSRVIYCRFVLINKKPLLWISSKSAYYNALIIFFYWRRGSKSSLSYNTLTILALDCSCNPIIKAYIKSYRILQTCMRTWINLNNLNFRFYDCQMYHNKKL
jgi:hypothetical protein